MTGSWDDEDVGRDEAEGTDLPPGESGGEGEPETPPAPRTWAAREAERRRREAESAGEEPSAAGPAEEPAEDEPSDDPVAEQPESGGEEEAGEEAEGDDETDAGEEGEEGEEGDEGEAGEAGEETAEGEGDEGDEDGEGDQDEDRVEDEEAGEGEEDEEAGESEEEDEDEEEDVAAEEDADDRPTTETQDQPLPVAAPLGDEPTDGSLTPADGAIPAGMVVPRSQWEAAQRLIADEEEIKPAGHGLWWRYLAASLVIVASIAAATSVSILLYLSDIAEGLGRGKEELKGVVTQLQTVDVGDPQTIMIVGSDRRYGDKKKGIPSRSDTVILVRLDPHKEAIAVFSLPRDLKVNIPGHGVDKLNVAYAVGGPKLTLKVVRQLTGLEVHHLVNVNFRGFKQAVNAIGCVYFDVDRRYFNSNLGKPASQHYAEIDLKPGYQKLCGQDALDFVRYRHTDNDLVRSARQQEFLRQARQKMGPGRLLRDRNKLIDIFKQHTTSDIDDPTTMLEVFKLFLASRQSPVREVHFKGELGESYVTSSERQIRDAVEQFLGVRATGGPRGKLKQRPKATRKKKRRKRKDPTAGAKVGDVSQLAGQHARQAQARLHFPVFYPTKIERGSQLIDQPRTYDLYSPDKTKHRAYKIVIRNFFQEYYGVTGTTWRNPPILKDPSETRTIGKRRYTLYFDDKRLRLVAWRTQRGVYWLQNTLLQSLTEREMLAIAKSMKQAIP